MIMFIIIFKFKIDYFKYNLIIDNQKKYASKSSKKF